MLTSDEKTSIEDLAAQWVVRLDARTPSEAEEQALSLWLDQDVRHYGAFMRARAIYLRFDELRRLQGVPAAATSPVEAPQWTPAPSSFSRRRLLWLGGAALAAGAAGAGLLVWDADREFTTRMGEIRRVSLPDGSAMTLNTQTQLSLHFTDLVREVRILGGEALFEVAEDPARLFRVDSFGTRVTAKVAAFTVSALHRDAVQILVRSGQVQVSQPSVGSQEVVMAANTQLRPETSRAVVSVSPLPVRIDPVELDRRLAWQRGELSFEDITLDDALQQFARYSDTRVVLDTPAIGSLKVVGLFSASDPVGFARTVAISLGLKLDFRDGVAHLTNA